MMAHHALLFLTNSAKRSIKTHVTTYENYSPDTGETTYDVPTILSIIFQKLCPNVWVNVFNKIGSMKDVILARCDGNHANLIETWNRFGLETVLNNVNMKWGDK